jgi:hypothetical protein
LHHNKDFSYCHTRWDHKKRRYIDTSGSSDRKGNKKIRTESGKAIEASTAGKGLYQKWAKQNKARVAALGTAEDAGAPGDLARRFDKGFRHKSWKMNGEKGERRQQGKQQGRQQQQQQRGPSELKSKEQVAKQRQKKQALQQRMQERRKVNEAKKNQKGRKGRK